LIDWLIDWLITLSYHILWRNNVGWLGWNQWRNI